MPLRIADLAANRRTFTLSMEGGSLQVTYRPYEMTPAMESEFSRMADEARANLEDEGAGADTVATDTGISKLFNQFCTIVDSWDLVGPLTDPTSGTVVVEEDKPIPIKPEYLRYCSNLFLVNVLNGIVDDSRPKARR